MPKLISPHLKRAAIVLLAGLTTSGANAKLVKYTVQKDVVFTPGDWPADLVGDLYRPKSRDSAPAVLLIHGGGWNGDERRSDMTGIARSLARRGFFVMNTTYRRTPDWKFPAQTDDLRQAIRFIRENSKSLNVDGSRVATFGYSAGGHLAALIGLDPKNRVKAIVAGGAPSDLRFWPNGRLTGLLLGGPLKGREKVYREASPVTLVSEGSPPVFLYHGTNDNLVSMGHPRAFISALRQNGVDHETYWIEGRSHIMAHLFPAGAISKAIGFLEKHIGTRALNR